MNVRRGIPRRQILGGDPALRLVTIRDPSLEPGKTPQRRVASAPAARRPMPYREAPAPRRLRTGVFRSIAQVGSRDTREAGLPSMIRVSSHLVSPGAVYLATILVARKRSARGST